MKNKSRIVVLGNKGMLGHVVEKYFIQEGYDVKGINREDVDFNCFGELSKKVVEFRPNYVINCAGILNTGTSLKDFGRINVALPHFLNSFESFKLIHISTNCVFKSIGPHEDHEVPDATDWYGLSKAMGEVSGKALTIRTSIIGPELKESGSGLFNWFIQQKEATGYANAHWNGVTTLQLAKFVQETIENDYSGIINYCTNQPINKADLLETIKKVYELDVTIKRVEKEGVHSSILNGLFCYNTYEEQLEELKSWYE